MIAGVRKARKTIPQRQIADKIIEVLALNKIFKISILLLKIVKILKTLLNGLIKCSEEEETGKSPKNYKKH